MAGRAYSAKAPAMSLACLVPHYGPVALTLRCLASLERGSLRPLTVVISNEADDTELQKTLALRHPWVSLLSLGQNRGFAAACNAGMAELAGLRATGHALEYIWLLNNDAWAAPDAAARLLHGLRNNPGKICGTSILRTDSLDSLECALGRCFVPWLGLLLPGRGEASDYAHGASLAFSWDIWQKTGPFDEDFFLYYEEHDFCLRARQAGFGLAWIQGARVWHGHPERGSRDCLALRQYHENLSTLLFLRKHFAKALPSALATRLAAKLLLLPLRGQTWLLLPAARAVRDFFRYCRSKPCLKP